MSRITSLKVRAAASVAAVADDDQRFLVAAAGFQVFERIRDRVVKERFGLPVCVSKAPPEAG